MRELLNYAFIYQPMTLREVIDTLGSVHSDMVIPGMGAVLYADGRRGKLAVYAEPTAEGEWYTASELVSDYLEQFESLTRYGLEPNTDMVLHIGEGWDSEPIPVIGFQPLGSVMRPVLLDDPKNLL